MEDIDNTLNEHYQAYAWLGNLFGLGAAFEDDTLSSEVDRGIKDIENHLE